MAFDPDKYIAEKTAAAPTSKVFDPDAYLKSKNEVVTAAPPVDAPKSTFEKVQDVVAQGSRHIPILGTAMNPAVQDAAMRGLDYLGGAVRTGLAGIGGVASKDDLYAALKGKAPRTSEYLAKGGVPEGPSLYGANLRGAVGLAGDIATDPLTYVNPAGALGEFSKATKAAGETMYKSGLKNIDIEAAKYGKEPVSDLLMKERVTGSARSIANQMDELAAKRKMERDALLQAAGDAGAVTDPVQSMANAQDFINKLSAGKDPRLSPLIQKMDDEAKLLYGVKDATPAQLSQMKTNTYSVIGDAGYDQAKNTPLWKQYQKAVASGQKAEVERSVGQALGPDAGLSLKQKNDELGRLLTTQDRAERDAAIYDRKNGLTSVDAMIAGHGMQSGHGFINPMLILKKLGDLSKESVFRTPTGLGLQDLGQTRIPDVLTRRAIIDYNNPWEMQK